jgi:CCR4-NOT transcription complex subunit 7/8
MASTTPPVSPVRQVWAHNVVQELHLIQMMIEQGKHMYGSIDTEFPGFVYKASDAKDFWTRQWDELKANVDNLRLIQFGLALSDASGQPPPGCGVWQFNFQFDVKHDMRSESSIQLLREAGCDFTKHQEEGICPYTFGDLLVRCGLVLNENMKWISFHGGYDFAYLIKVLTGLSLPARVCEMLDYVDLFFPRRCDMKYLLRDTYRGGLQTLATRRGSVENLHQAGTDAALTRDAFFAQDPDFRRRAFEAGDVGILCGLGACNARGIDPAAVRTPTSAEQWRRARSEWLHSSVQSWNPSAGSYYYTQEQHADNGGRSLISSQYFYEQQATDIGAGWARNPWQQEMWSWPDQQNWVPAQQASMQASVIRQAELVY